VSRKPVLRHTKKAHRLAKVQDMGRTIKVAAAQTGPVLSEDMAPGVEVACRMIEQVLKGGAKGSSAVEWPIIKVADIRPQ
jgi:hypothetical protein